jgi:hypothetical protein
MGVSTAGVCTVMVSKDESLGQRGVRGEQGKCASKITSLQKSSINVKCGEVTRSDPCFVLR